MMFTIIIPHYDKSISDEDFERCLMSLHKQTYKDFEVLIYHDGDLSRPISTTAKILIKNLKAKLFIEKHVGVWGHNNRDKGIRKAKGKYIIHLNADNVLYDLNDIVKFITETGEQNIYIFPLKMIGMVVLDNGKRLVRTRNINDVIILNGNPKKYQIDCMQLVATKEQWLKIGGWYNWEEESDGDIYEEMCKLYPYVRSEIVIGEHW